MSGWIVLLDNGNGKHYAYGPIQDAEHARRFAAFMTREVDPAKVATLIDPIGELLAYEQRMEGLAKGDQIKAIYWPPSPGEVWEDRSGDRWVCHRMTRRDVSYLTCLARIADDNAEEIWRQHGPMTRVHFVAPTKDEEPPF